MSSAALLRPACLALALAATAHALAGVTPAAPPAFPDEQHVANGCFISATTYLARFRAEFPSEGATTLAIEPRGYPGKHTIAVVTWAGRWWGRDEYFGVFALDCAVANAPEPRDLTARAAKIFARHASNEIRAGRGEIAPRLGGSLTGEERARLVGLAARLLPCGGEIFWVHSGAEESPFLFFRPGAGQVAIYDPASGTCRAACAGEAAADLVREAATQLGYAVRAVRPDFAPPSGPLLAATTTAPHALHR